jgi:predicted O-methyltransferase YrrM
LSVLIDLYNQKDIFYVDEREPRYSSDENLQFVIDRMDKYRGIDIIQEDSLTALPRLLNRKEYFDFIYLDASHKYQDVVLDIEASCALLKDDGILGLNDYIWTDEDGREYGVILAVNKFLVANKDWEVIGFALHDRMYADIYLRKKLTQPV